MATTADEVSIPARLFGENLPATGVDATLTMHGERIEVTSEHHTLSRRIADVRIRDVGFGGEMGFELAWQDAGDAFAVHVLQPSAVRRLVAHPNFAASQDVKALTRTQRKRFVGRSFAALIVAAIVLLPLLLVLIFIWQADRIAATLTENIGIEREVELGNAAFESMRPSLRLIDDGASLQAVQALGTRLLGDPIESKYTYRFHVVEDASINAFALPGGIIVVHTGLIAATQRPEELAGVLAHEMQHVEQRHSLRGLVKELGLRGVWAFVTGDVGGTLAGQAALELTSRKFSRNDEASADSGAFDMLIAQQIDPTGMADFFTTMSRRAESQVPELLSTHPASEERKRKLTELSQRHAGTFEPLNTANWPPTGSKSSRPESAIEVEQ